MSWYENDTIMEYLDNLDITFTDCQNEPFRFPVQYINRPNLNFRGFSGNVISGVASVGDEVVVLPSMKQICVKITNIYLKDRLLLQALK